ncbi:MAG: hypothetical protein F4060_03710 [Holophagales bacterium]|nr:hypothetical protein [Holophagales bacterium]MYG31951.1 hypothetical protein [Holophagales bacterium]MYI79022.1 hypothetical protein [Holophagales bacterium]
MTPEADQASGLPPLPEPFPEPQAARSADPERTRRGCLVASLVGCGLLVVLFIVGLAVMVTQADELLEFVLDFSRERIVAELPEDVQHAERQRLERAFDSVLEHYRSGAATPADNRRLQLALTDAIGRLERGLFDQDDLRRLTDRLENIAASDAGG